MKDGADAEVTEYHLPCAEALLAGTLALMTAYVQSQCPEHREHMVIKIRGNFGALTAHLALSAAFRATLGHLQEHWQRLGEGAPDREVPRRDVIGRNLH